MSTSTSVRQSARRAQLFVSLPWQRCQCRIAAAYFRRVTLPLQWWQALGRPPQFTPQLPWWQPLAWRWLVLTGWLSPHRLTRSFRWDSGQ